MLRKIIIVFLSILSFSQAFAQVNPDSTKKAENQNPVIIILNDSTKTFSDTTQINDQTITDSLAAREQFIRDSIFAREQFIRDSLLAREQFVKDSLYHRKLILDSVTFLKQNLPQLVDAALRLINEEIIIFTKPVYIIGDSTLSDFKYVVLAQKTDDPYAPWRKTVELSGNSFKVKVDTINKKIISIRTPEINYSFDYDDVKKVIRINGRSTVTRKHDGYVYKNYYKTPIDSVFFDSKGRVIKIKKYTQYFEATEKFKKGGFLFTDLELVKEFRYFPDGILSMYRERNYCGRWSGKEKNELCHTVTYTITRQGQKFIVQKKHEPKNNFSDATIIFEFDNHFDMKSIEFKNSAKALSKKCIIELNEDRNVSRYLYEKDGKINRTILIHYNDNPNAKYKVEKIVCYFEDDGISYYQKNVTTGKSRRRDKLTLEWSPWK